MSGDCGPAEPAPSRAVGWPVKCVITRPQPVDGPAGDVVREVFATVADPLVAYSGAPLPDKVEIVVAVC